MARSESKGGARTRRRDRRAEGRMMAWGVVIAGIVSVVWMWREQTRTKTHVPASVIYRQLENEYRRAAVAGRTEMGHPGFAAPAMYSVNGPPRPAPVPRYFANLATDIGDYVVSVRQVITDFTNYNLFLSPASQHSLLTDHSFTLSIQVLAKSPRAYRRIRDYAVDLTAVDDLGAAHHSDERYDSVAFPNGLARLVHFHGVEVRTRFLKELSGEILVSDSAPSAPSPDPSADRSGGGDAAPDPSIQRLKFKIVNVPLPMNPLVYGVTAARYISLDEARSAGFGGFPAGRRYAVAAGEAMAGLRRLFPPYVEEPVPLKLPSRLIMIPDVSNRFALNAVGAGKPSAPVNCALTPHVGDDGDIRCGLMVLSPDGSRSVQADVDLWDHEQAVVVLPVPAMKGKTVLALLLHLYLDVRNEQPVENVRANPFLAHTGDRGGAVIGEVQVQNHAVHDGFVQFEIQRMEDGGRAVGDRAVLEAAVDKDGSWELPNLAAGRYEIKLRGLLPSASRFGTVRSPIGYMRHRFGLKQPAWNRAELEHVTLRAGGLVRLEPWVLADAADAKAKDYLSMAR